MTRRTSLACLIALAAAAPVAGVAAGHAPTPEELRTALAPRVQQLAAAGGDVTALAARDPELAALLDSRPETTGLVTLALADPPVTVTFPAPAPSGPLVDEDLDGMPDRVRAALDAAGATLARLEDAGLREPGADLELYLLPLGSVARGWIGLDGTPVAGRGARGFVVVNIVHPAGSDAVHAATARFVARLALAGLDADAPQWWLEPSVAWFELQAAGPSLEIASAIRSRWSQPELGLQTGLARIARGNVGLLLALEDPRLAQRVLRETWSALARRAEIDSRDDVVIEALRRSTGTDVAELQARAAIRALVDGLEPTRWAAEVAEVPAGGIQTTIHAGPWGGALLSLRPDPLGAAATRLSASSSGPGWTLSLIARRHDGRWERIYGRDPAGGIELLVPWRDYERAVVVMIRDGRGSAREIELLIDDAGADALFALASVSARHLPDGSVEIAWRTGWERELFGWLVERSDAPDRPFQAIDELPAPALGSETGGAFYRLRDPA
ncbi:MAG: hypothetical protein D6738_01450, partial [Acidobacteria bacterium]